MNILLYKTNLLEVLLFPEQSHFEGRCEKVYRCSMCAKKRVIKNVGCLGSPTHITVALHQPHTHKHHTQTIVEGAQKISSNSFVSFCGGRGRLEVVSELERGWFRALCWRLVGPIRWLPLTNQLPRSVTLWFAVILPTSSHYLVASALIKVLGIISKQ
jgi:hypothetical protein